MTGIKSPSMGVLAAGALVLFALKWGTADEQPVVQTPRVNALREDVRLLARMDLMDRRLQRLSQLDTEAAAEQAAGQVLDQAGAPPSREAAGHPTTGSAATRVRPADRTTAALPQHVSTREAARAAAGRTNLAAARRH